MRAVGDVSITGGMSDDDPESDREPEVVPEAKPVEDVDGIPTQEKRWAQAADLVMRWVGKFSASAVVGAKGGVIPWTQEVRLDLIHAIERALVFADGKVLGSISHAENQRREIARLTLELARAREQIKLASDATSSARAELANFKRTDLAKENAMLQSRVDEMNILVSRADERAAARFQNPDEDQSPISKYLANRGFPVQESVQTGGGNSMPIRKSVYERVVAFANERDAKIHNLRAKLEQRQMPIEDLQRQVVQKENRISQLERDVSVLGTEKKGLEDDIAELREDGAEPRANCATRMTLDSDDPGLEALEDELDEVQGRLEALEGRVEDIVGAVTSQVRRLARYTNQERDVPWARAQRVAQELERAVEG